MEFSHTVIQQADVRNPARGHKIGKHHPEGKDVRRKSKKEKVLDGGQNGFLM